MTRLIIALTAVALVAACATGPRPQRSLNDPTVKALYALPLPEMYGTLRAARTLSAQCSRYGYDAALAQVLDERRTADAGQLAVVRARAGMAVMEDVVVREFQARTNATAGVTDICTGLDAEYDSGSALSAALVRKRG